jgi:hypothetical protein
MELIVEVSEGGAIVALAVLLWKTRKDLRDAHADSQRRLQGYLALSKRLYDKQSSRLSEHIKSRLH